MPVNDPLLSLFGIARRCGKIAAGFDAAADAVARRRASALFIAPDAAERTQRNARRIAGENGAQVILLDVPMQQLGAAIGMRPTGIVALPDPGFEKKARALAAEAAGNAGRID